MTLRDKLVALADESGFGMRGAFRTFSGDEVRFIAIAAASMALDEAIKAAWEQPGAELYDGINGIRALRDSLDAG